MQGFIIRGLELTGRFQLQFSINFKMIGRCIYHPVGENIDVIPKGEYCLPGNVELEQGLFVAGKPYNPAFG